MLVSTESDFENKKIKLSLLTDIDMLIMVKKILL